MIESVMYFAIGFFVAVVIGLGLFPLVHNRAVRLTGQRLEAATPVSMAEIQADKDQLAELGKKSDAINRLKLEIGEKAAALFTMESREKSLRDQIRTTEEELAAKTAAMHETERTLADRQAELAKLTNELGERTFLTDSQRVEIVALRTQVEALRGQVDRFEADIRTAEQQLAKQREEAETATRELQVERGRGQTLGLRVAELEQQVVTQSTEAQELGRRVLQLEARLGEQGKKLAERDYEVIRLRSEIDNSQRVEADLRAEIAASEDRHNGTSARLRSENTVLENELAQLRNDRTALQQEVTALKREAETTWASERVENALLRERINDIATEVARLTMVLEGPGSPIEAMLSTEQRRADERPGAARARVVETPPEPEPGTGSLADRIRALQARASRIVPTASSA
jgi:chromosome segregation ATPase